jgi:hypothetical protein
MKKNIAQLYAYFQNVQASVKYNFSFVLNSKLER